MQRHLTWLGAVVLALCACTGPRALRVTDADRPRALPEAGPVNVRWADPAGFSELRFSLNRNEAARGDWVAQLAGYLRERSTRQLPAGQHLDVEILDIQRAGQYEHIFGTGEDVRVLRDVYPPRMRLHIRRTDAGGRVIEEGERRLGDLAYLSMPQPMSDSDPLRYEKRMIDRWARRELGARQASR